MREKYITWLDGIIEWSLYGLIFTLPFSKSMVEIFFVIAFIAWIMKRIILKTFRPVRTALNLPITAYILAGVLSTIYSRSVPLSLEGLFLKLLEGVMIYFIVAETFNSRERLGRILAVMLLSMLLISADGMFQYLAGRDFIRGRLAMGIGIRGPFDNPNGFAGWVVAMSPLALSLAYFGVNNRLGIIDKYKWIKKNFKSIMWFVSALLVVSLFLTYAKGALIAFLVSLVFLGIFKSRKLLMILMTLILIFLVVHPGYVEKFADSTRKILEVNKFDRPRMWGEALSVIEDFPLVGCGLNTYAEFMPIYPHNSYLHMAAEAGLFGLGTFVWMMTVLFMTSLTNLKRMGDGFYHTVLIGLLAGLFGFLAHSFVEVNIFTLQLGNLMWFIMGLIIAVQNVSLGGVDDQEKV